MGQRKSACPTDQDTNLLQQLFASKTRDKWRPTDDPTALSQAFQQESREPARFLSGVRQRHAVLTLRGESLNQSSACSGLAPSSLADQLASEVQLHSSRFLCGKMMQRQAHG